MTLKTEDQPTELNPPGTTPNIQNLTVTPGSTVSINRTDYMLTPEGTLRNMASGELFAWPTVRPEGALANR